MTGSHGLIGTALLRRLEARGDDVVRFVRRRPRGPDEAFWDPTRGRVDTTGLNELDFVINLAGANIGIRPWTPARRRQIRGSRVAGTSLLARTLAELRIPPATMLSASAVGFYGDRGDEVLTEESPTGQGFRADVCRQWEAATASAEEAGIRTVHLRFGIVLSPEGGLLPYLLRPPFAPRFGSGDQFWSWISIDDAVDAILHLLEQPSAGGPINVTAPRPVRQGDLADAIGEATGRRVIGIPRVALELALGPQRAREVLLSSERAVPARLLAGGFVFCHRDVASALRSVGEMVGR